jgi:hypothetical protein
VEETPGDGEGAGVIMPKISDKDAEVLRGCIGKAGSPISYRVGTGLIRRGLAVGSPTTPEITQAGLLALGRWLADRERRGA